GEHGSYRTVEVTSDPIGRYHFTKPDIRQIPLESGLTIVLFTDGIPHSGRRARLGPLDYRAFAEGNFEPGMPAQEMADRLLDHAIERDQGRPGDDMAVVALRITDHLESRVIRRMQAQFPMP
ncbi:MAG TPA: SpoIIE family protein phosphatase, partial [Thermomicrobiales bacterium]|nr:SpoIIE family protein phosphatase [Thermomicrobiales bacterium]